MGHDWVLNLFIGPCGPQAAPGRQVCCPGPAVTVNFRLRLGLREPGPGDTIVSESQAAHIALAVQCHCHETVNGALAAWCRVGTVASDAAALGPGPGVPVPAP